MKNTRQDNLMKDASEIVYNRKTEKAKEYGPFEESMAASARIASELTGKDITTEDFYKCMMALKLARLKYSSKEDTMLDLLAYTGGLVKYQKEKEIAKEMKIEKTENHMIDAFRYSTEPLKESLKSKDNE
jgi:hypothetical protein